jgi:hypothetical protein
LRVEHGYQRTRLVTRLGSQQSEDFMTSLTALLGFKSNADWR